MTASETPSRPFDAVLCDLDNVIRFYDLAPLAELERAAGLAEGKLPVGMQIIGRRYADVDVLAASATFERLRPWHETYQLCAARPL